MATNYNDTTIAGLKQLMANFQDERNWKKHRTPKNLAMSIAIEDAELMRNFQWDDYTETDHQDI